ncbi:hypothetical protein [Dongia sp.]|uniref:hypothetical protein n=1 Tax=Dongia sp. TaxID=1977262 RepID=UPI0035B0A1A5
MNRKTVTQWLCTAFSSKTCFSFAEILPHVEIAERARDLPAVSTWPMAALKFEPANDGLGALSGATSAAVAASLQPTSAATETRADHSLSGLPTVVTRGRDAAAGSGSQSCLDSAVEILLN